MSDLVKRGPELTGPLGAKSIFDIAVGLPIAETLYVPETHYLLIWSRRERTWHVKDACGYYSHELTRLARRVLGTEACAEDYHLLGKILQGGFGAN
jgi:hypothetical protein